MADGELGFLGLTHNPFVSESGDFFEGGDRKTHLEQVRHLRQWTRHVTLVTGPLGVGKTTLYRQVSMTLEPRVKAARLNGVLVNTARDVLNSIAQGLGATVNADANVQSIAQALATYIIGQDRQGRFCLVMVDDAQLLDLPSLEELLKLTRTSPVYVCLFGEPGLVNSVAKPAARNELSWHEIRLAGLALPDIEKYLIWKLSLAQYRGRLPFSPTQLNRLAKQSGGLPAAINHVGAELIERLESGKTGTGGVQFPVAHGLIVVLLVVVFSLVYLVLNGSENGAPDGSRVSVTRIQLPGGSSAGDTPTQPLTENGQAPVESGEDLENESLSSTRMPLPLPNLDQETTAESTVQKSPPGKGTMDPSSAASSERGVSDTAAPTPLPRPVVPATEGAREVPGEVGRGEVTSSERDMAGQQTKSPLSGNRAAQVQSRVPADARDAAWLSRQAPSDFTIQLVSLSTEERLVAYLLQQRDRQQFAWYPIVRGGKRLYVVTYGQFDSKAAADTAAASLPSEVGKVEPWVRPLKLIQEAIAAGT